MFTFVYRDKLVCRCQDGQTDAWTYIYYCPECGDIFAKRVPDVSLQTRYIDLGCERHISRDIRRRFFEPSIFHIYEDRREQRFYRNLKAIEFLHLTGGLDHDARTIDLGSPNSADRTGTENPPDGR